MAKWKPRKKSNELAEKIAIARIRASDRHTESSELTKDQEDIRYHFAFHCHKLRYQNAPSGTPWPEVFRKHHGMSLSEYGELLRQRQKEKREAHSTPEDDCLP